MPDREAVLKRMEQMETEAESGGYFLNPDKEFVYNIIDGLLANEARYGFSACPCRFVHGPAEANKDIICPCVYRDDDIDEYGACFCALYVSPEYKDNPPSVQVPDRRPPGGQPQNAPSAGKPASGKTLAYPIYRCTVCGYLCARNNPPAVCPVCKAKKDRFELFISNE
ncbi:MAG: ferredoxin-thioredoxin reductase catalytic domain-containing protein [Christensenellaceae bacterium]|jgi:ferredoxin-thioredoxin reductase catalytic chain